MRRGTMKIRLTLPAIDVGTSGALPWFIAPATYLNFYCKLETDSDYSRIKLVSYRDAALYTAQLGY